ncbi:MAG: hypothetical protein SFV15_14000 [Polyangiaceae bacterium]|nr:hypothetical protein [Polyangiaceae bacterium]
MPPCRRSSWSNTFAALAWLLSSTSCSTSLSSAGGSALAGKGPNAGGDPATDSGLPPSPQTPNPPPPEIEAPLEFEQPHAGEHFCYVANPDTNRVSVIDARSLAIHSVEAGDHPTYLETLNGKDVAIVLNIASSDASILRTDLTGASRVTRVALTAGSNSIRVAPDGKHAVSFFDSQKSSLGSTGSFQDVNIITVGDGALVPDTAVTVSVGFRPSRVFFDSSSTHAFVVTEDGVSIIELASSAEAGIARTLALVPKIAAKTLDVSVTPDGKYALGRSPGSSLVYLLDLVTGGVQTLDLSPVVAKASASNTALQVSEAGAAGQANAGAPGMAGTAGASGGTPSAGAPPPNEGGAGGASSVPPFVAEVTDVDLAENGELAVAVVRNASAVVSLPLPAAFNDPEQAHVEIIEGEAIGSVTLTPNAEQALLYTTAQATVERLTRLNLKTFTWEARDIRKMVRSVVITADNSTAIVVHEKAPGDPSNTGIDPEVVIDRSYGYSLIALNNNGFSKLQTTAAEVGPMSVMPDGKSLFVLVNGPDARAGQPDVHTVERVGLTDFIVTRLALGSPPFSLGAVPGAGKAWVGQRHPDGRITFFDFAAQRVESVTGYELNSRVRE